MELLTIRDHFRWAVSQFNKASLQFGHGTSNAIDEAAFLVLESLSLPVDDINPWADARLTRQESAQVRALIQARISSRKPAAYLTRSIYMQGVRFYIDERAIVPRSYLGEILHSELFSDNNFGLISDRDAVGSVLDLCTGCGALAILAAQYFPNATIDAVDLSPSALEVAKINIDHYDMAERIEIYHGDLFEPIDYKTYDLILTNPPYVAQKEVANFPPEYACEPAMAHLGGEDGLDIVRKILKEVPGHLNPSGGLMCEVGLGRDILIGDYPQLDFIWLDTEESQAEVFWLQHEDLNA